MVTCRDKGVCHSVCDILDNVRIFTAGDSVIIVNAIHVFFPGHTWVPHRLFKSMYSKAKHIINSCCLFLAFEVLNIVRTPRSTNFSETDAGLKWEVKNLGFFFEVLGRTAKHLTALQHHWPTQ